MKNKKNRIAAAIGGLMLCASFAANATLEPRLSGMAYYDTDTRLTWAAPKHTLDLGLNYSGYDAFMPTFELGGTGDWAIPQWRDLINFVANHSIIIGWGGPGSIPLPPLESWGNNFWYWAEDGLLIGGRLYPNAFSPAMLDSYPFTESTITFFGVWPVHHGDVPLVAVPEPSTYTLLLAGLGLFGYMGHRQAKQ
ncbi:PEP-CTERM sorting domain-containing protein [Nitrosomonas sp. Is35]|uniref:PEP-CTERM sorting domain-containing protein n=1 Tax=Nitrosomonas sp. Is35 TaxID=3080534 RepID=UPI00294B2238|nr:PEP-CTERM sorting domain-containing protein [Nitrosomonas sp. Is35]MDV6346964.1 PEP-CTERM sorting domain-containing protein [Nitrosomonas sp. Is35]